MMPALHVSMMLIGVVAIGLFTSIGWSNTFSLALEGTGVLKSQVSSLLVMAILGGAILPPLQGKIADVTKNLQISFIVPLYRASSSATWFFSTSLLLASNS